MTPEYAAQLTNFRNYAWSLAPAFGQQIDLIIGVTMPAGLGLVAEPDVTVQVKTTTAIEDFVNTVSKTYLDSVGAYYRTKAEIAKLKAASTGGLPVDIQQALQSLKTGPAGAATPWLLMGGGLLLVLLLVRK